MNDLQPLQSKLNSLIANLSPQARTQLARQIGKQLTQSQRQRIAQQKNPDGTAYAPRKSPRKRSKKGKIKQQAMFAKLKTARFMRQTANAQGVSLGYTGQNAFIANVHQFGLSSRVSKRASYKVKYDQRELLGFTEQDIEMIEDLVIEKLAKGE